MKKNTLILLSGLFILILSGCYTPSPLYGTWSDNVGNKISFMTDGTFSAQIVNAAKETDSYEGTYNVIDNTLVFNILSDNSTRVTEWDMRGAILYLYFTDTNNQNEIKILTLYHISR